MKIKYTLFLFSALLFAACQQTHTHSESSAEHTGAGHEGHTDTDHGGLTLNEGQKWDADEITAKHVAALETQISTFDKNGQTDVESYKALGGNLSSELNGLIADCKMTGPDHDALHQWLEPYLQDVSTLKNVATTNQGAETVKSLNNRIQLFQQHFN